MQIATRGGAASILVMLSLGVLGSIGMLGVVTDATASHGATECFGCYPYVQICPNGGHEDRTITSYPYWTGGEFHSDCHLSNCSDYHTTNGCLESLAAAKEIDLALPLLEQKRWAALATLVAGSRTARFNAERGALQFTGCGSMIAAHIPIADDDAKQLMQEITNALNE